MKMTKKRLLIAGGGKESHREASKLKALFFFSGSCDDLNGKIATSAVCVRVLSRGAAGVV